MVENEMKNPSGVGQTNQGIFGLGTSQEDAACVLIPVAWDATTSYMAGTHKGPESILKSSPQIDFYHPDFPDLWQQGVYMPPAEAWIAKENKHCREKVEAIIRQLENGDALTESLLNDQTYVNRQSAKLTSWLREEVTQYLNQHKLVGVIGGDHSVPLGMMQALAEKHASFGVLHIDAHHDYRDAFMGFHESHASIMHNAAKIPEIKRFVQVGIRDYCEEEVHFTQSDTERFITFYDMQLKENAFIGKHWHQQCEEIIAKLPEKIYISFDIDGLAPHLCPSTGTPVPGGITYEQVLYLIKMAAKKCEIIGFDLVEVGGEPDSIDAITAVRIIWNMCGYGLSSKS